ncbi:unnamed protein product [Diatraea saccharalis]|uniref:Gem-associated protein 5 n=1 Tax=Diatraea saccharalis TaxID=40085 RepID=A0A9N9R8T4_9NEOP|nr:unnamed protein product [Diatraea saccharalis]
MDETVILPSPNWFQVSGLATSKDGWLVYGGPSKSLCVLQPVPLEYDGVIVGTKRYHAHVVNRAHLEKIVSVDISPEWPDKRFILTGSVDGSVKQWNLEQLQLCQIMKSTHSHDVHSRGKEEIAGVGYSNESCAITVGCFGIIVKWNLNSNVVTSFNHLRNFKPVCMSCSPHIPLNVAVGTKQGVVFVLDLNGTGKIVYKVRGQDDEVSNLSWCPQYEVSLKKILKESEKRGNNPNATNEEVSTDTELNASGCEKNLPDDSFNESQIVAEDDMFDIYKDHEADEFGHKKYQPEEILVKVHQAVDEKGDYLAECLKLKEDIIKRKNQADASIQSLVDSLDKTHVHKSEDISDTKDSDMTKVDEIEASEHIHKHLLATISKYGSVRVWSKSGKLIGSCVIPNMNSKHSKNKAPFWPTLLWYKSNVLLLADGKNNLLECNPLKLDCKNKLDWNVVHTLHKRNIYCIASNAPRVQSSNEANEEWSIWTTSQDRNIIQYSLSERHPVAIHATCGGFIYSVQPCPYDAGKIAISAGDGTIRIWNSSISEENENKLQDDHVTCYWQNVLGKVLVIAWHPTKENLLAFATAESRVGLIDTSGRIERPAKTLVPALRGAVYSISWGEHNDLYACAAGELVVYDTSAVHDADGYLQHICWWKFLTMLIQSGVCKLKHSFTGGTPPRTAREGKVASFCFRWRRGSVALYNTYSFVLSEPRAVPVVVDGQPCEVSCVRHTARALLCGTAAGALALLTPRAPHAALAAAHVYSKMIYAMEWHPQQTSFSSEESQYKNLIAVCSMDKQNKIVILEYIEGEDGSKHLQTWKTLSGSKSPVYQVSWNPHRDAQLLSTSQDCTVRVWDVSGGGVAGAYTCASIFSGHGASALCGAWSAQPALERRALSGGADCCLRLWHVDHHPAAHYRESLHDVAVKKEKKKNKKQKDKKEPKEEVNNEEPVMVESDTVAASLDSKKYLERTSPDKLSDGTVNAEESFNLDYVKLFGSINEVNELLDEEMDRHEASGNTEAWAMLSMFRGQVDKMIQFASQRDLLCPFLLSLAPCVSFKYWKDATQLYIAQIDRLVAKGEEEKLYEKKTYGGPIYRKVATLLSIHDVKGAVTTLTEADLYKEAYILCRTRYMDSIAKQTLQQWAAYCVKTGTFIMAAVCYIALEDLSQAAIVLGKLNDQDALKLASDIAKIIGQNTFAEHIFEKQETIKNSVISDRIEEILKELPSRMEALMSDGDKKQNGDTYSVESTDVTDSGDTKE